MTNHDAQKQLEALSDAELCILCYDMHPRVYSRLNKDTSKRQILRWIQGIEASNSGHYPSFDTPVGHTADLKRRLLKLARDPIWQMVGVIIAAFALGWTIYNGGETPSGPASETPIQPSSTIVPPTKPTAMPSLTITTSSDCSQAFPMVDIQGRWNHSSGSFWIFIRMSPFTLDYSYQEFEAGGSGWGEGNAYLTNNKIIIEGHNGLEFANQYSGELCFENNTLLATIKNTDSGEVVTTFTGTPAAIPTPLAASSSSTTDITGRWDASYGAFVIFSRQSATSPDYSYQELMPGGSSWGEGTASFDGNKFILKGHNGLEFENQYSGELYVQDTQLSGWIKDAFGNEIPVTLSQSP